MLTEINHTLFPFVRKLQLWGPLSEEDQRAILALTHRVEHVRSQRYLVREGDHPSHSCLLIEGFAFRHKVLIDGSRSINAVHIKGDVVDLQNSLLGTADHSVQTLTDVTVAYIPRDEVRRLAFERPTVGMAMWYDTLVDGSIFREWIANIARRDAPARLAHLLCELGLRFEAVGLGKRSNFELPMTQEQLADATGMTAVHVNRSLMLLENSGVIERDKKQVSIGDWDRLVRTAGFDETYLHLKEHDGLTP